MMELVTLHRPIGAAELALIIESEYRAFPPRLVGQPFFYPVTNEEYAVLIARDWNVKESGVGYVTRFRVPGEYLARYPVHRVGASMHTELWIPAEELAEFNGRISGAIEVIREFRAEGEMITRPTSL